MLIILYLHPTRVSQKECNPQYRVQPWRSLLQNYSTRMWFLYLDIGSIWGDKYFKYSYISAKKIICEDIMKITQIIVEIWAHLFLWISLKIAKLHDRHYYYFCILRDIVLNYHRTKFGDNCITQCWNMSKTINWRLRTCLQFKDGIRRWNNWK